MKPRATTCACLLAVVSASAQSQEPPDCGGKYARQWQKHRKSLQALRTDQPGYRPYPYPATDEEVRANLRYEYMRMRGGEHGHPPKLVRERQLYDLIRADTFGTEVLRVENWTPGRCLEKRQEDFLFLVRILEPVHREEVARMQLTQEGTLGTWDFSSGHPPGVAAMWRSQVPPLASVAQALRDRFGVSPTRPRFVFAAMEGGRCSHLLPCVVLKAEGEGSYLHVPPHPGNEGGELFWFDERSPRIPFHLAVERGPLSSPPRHGAYGGQFTVSFGADESIVLTAVPPKKQD